MPSRSNHTRSVLRLALLVKLCQAVRDAEAVDLIDQETVAGPGNPTGANQHGEGNRDSITVSSPEPEHGNSEQYALRRLWKDRPDMHARVLAGENPRVQ